MEADEPIQISSVAWSEFLCGPVDDQALRLAEAWFPYPEPFTSEHARLAAYLFNVAGRRRNHLTDCMIAAVALASNEPLGTSNINHFRAFEAEGLSLVTVNH